MYEGWWFLIPINHLKFLKILIDHFVNKYPEVPKDIVLDIIVTICLDNPGAYFSYDMIQERSELCIQCGACCRQRGEPCRYFNGRTCDDYGARFDVCAEFPYYQIDDQEGLMLDPGCKFALRLAEQVIDKDIQREIKFLTD